MAFRSFSSSFMWAAALLVCAVSAQAETAETVVVEGAWARATLQGQKSSGAFMRLTAPEAMRLVRLETPAAGVAEVHEMKMAGDVMKMRAMPGLDLPAGQIVELKPGSYHVMLMDLKAPLVKGAVLPLTLVFKSAKGVEHAQLLQVPISATPPAGAKRGAMGHGGAEHKH